jgi:hypothetical protein
VPIYRDRNRRGRDSSRIWPGCERIRQGDGKAHDPKS